MSVLRPQIIKRDGRNEFAVLPYEEFVKLREQLEDYHDLCAIREAKREEAEAPTIALDELKKRLSH